MMILYNLYIYFVIYSNRWAPKEKAQKNIWMYSSPLAKKAKVAVIGEALNRKDKCIKGYAVTWKREEGALVIAIKKNMHVWPWIWYLYQEFRNKNNNVEITHDSLEYVSHPIH